ncbi:MAG TPA: DNA polymerase I [Armatimonadota bacterium]|nr:DNA polymerase I [Armatimonadota bacterium]
MATQKLAIIDAYSLLYRAFFAIPPLTNKQGEVTNAVYGFTTMLVKLLDTENPDYIAVAFDMPVATFRHEAYDGYKAQRAPMPDSLRPQVPMTREVLEAMRIPMLGVPGFEADDVIGTLARKGQANGFDVLIVTGDKDALQLVDDHIHVLSTKRGITDTVEYDRQAVMNRYGVTPEQLPCVKALMGDPSDNIPGVPGIGEKTAGKLIAQYGSLENLLEHADEVKGKVGAALATYAEQARQSKHLATIITDVPLDDDFTWDCCRRQSWDQERIRELFRRLDFRSLLDRLQPVAPDTAAAASTSQPMAAVRVISTPEEAALVATALREIGQCAIVPVAGDGDPLNTPLAGLAISAGHDTHIYLPLLATPPVQTSLFDEGEAQQDISTTALLMALAPVLADAGVKKIGEDLKRLALWLRTRGITLAGLSFDTQLAAYLIDPTARHGLSDVCEDYLQQHVDLPDLAETWRKGDMDALATAASERAQLVLRVIEPLRVGLAEYTLMPLFRDVEMPLINVLIEMEWRGVALDTEHLDDLSAELGKTIYQLEGEIYRLAGERFTINSPKQLQAILYDKLGLPKGRKTKTGYSTDADTLVALAERHEIVQHILTYRELTKLKSTYVDSLPKLINPRSGHIHTHFNQTVTATGRLSSSDPNLQNIPIRTPEGREIRRAFIPGEPGWVLLASDYSQIELRVLAHITGDEALNEVFRQGEDLHTATACRVFGVTPDQVTRDMRRMAKVVNFSIPYGTTAFGLANQLGSTRDVAEDLMHTYLTRFPGVAQYMDEVVRNARRDGYVTTLLGRRRLLPDLHAGAATVRQAAERTAINTPIQGSAADIMKLAMLRLWEALQAEPNLHAHLLLQVHDEVVLETPVGEVDQLARLVRTAMCDAYQLSVPLEVEVKVGPNWRDVSPKSEDMPPAMG